MTRAPNPGGLQGHTLGCAVHQHLRHVLYSRRNEQKICTCGKFLPKPTEPSK